MTSAFRPEHGVGLFADGARLRGFEAGSPDYRLLPEADTLNRMVLALVVFDLDGTLIDSSTDLANATNALVEELGGTPLPDARVVEMVGEGAAVLVRRALAAAGLDPETPDALDRFLTLYDARLLDHTHAYDGMVEALRHLGRQVPLAVLTNKPSRATERILDGLGLRTFFTSVVGGDTPAGRKPDPAGLLQLASAHGADPAATLLVGDSPIDHQTARRAGAQICLARYGFGFRFSSGDFHGSERFIDRPAQLPSIFGG